MNRATVGWTLLLVVCAAGLSACSSDCGCPSPCATPCPSPCAPYGTATYPSYGTPPVYGAPSAGAPSYGGTPSYGQPYGGGTGTSTQYGNVVTVQNHAYYPATLTVRPGTTVRWVNRDSVPHSATGNGFDVELSPGGEGSYTFSAAGSFDVHCRYHERMRGQVLVQ